jgi:hypothetical protein
MSTPDNEHKSDGTELVGGLAPGIDGKEDLETKIAETENAGVERIDQPTGGINRKPPAMRAPKASTFSDGADDGEQ